MAKYRVAYRNISTGKFVKQKHTDEREDYETDFPRGEQIPGTQRRTYRSKPQDWYRDWERDIKVIFVIAMCVITFAISAYIFNTFMDFMDALVPLLGLTEGPASGGGLLSFRNTANWVLALVVALLVGGGLVVLFFRQNEVNDSPYVEGE